MIELGNQKNNLRIHFGFSAPTLPPRMGGSPPPRDSEGKFSKWILRQNFWFPRSITRTHIQTCVWISGTSSGLHAGAPRFRVGADSPPTPPRTGGEYGGGKSKMDSEKKNRFPSSITKTHNIETCFPSSIAHLVFTLELREFVIISWLRQP